jgi:Secretion system C-terminal sorting domain
MKKILLSLSALVILGAPKLMAQDTIPNLGWEIWTQNTYASGAYDPNTGNGSNGWWEFNTFNFALLGSSPVTVFEGSANPHPAQGSHYASIVSDTMSKTSYGYLKEYGFNYARTNGLMFLAYLNVGLSGATIKSGVPFSNQLQQFNFSYRYIPNGADSCSCTIALYHWNGTSRTLLGGGYWSSNVKQTAWTTEQVPIHYLITTTMPDTIFIAFSACKLDSANGPQRGDTLDIDQGSLLLGVNNVYTDKDNVTVYPNPASTEINLAVKGNYQANVVEVYDITGKMVDTYSMHNNLLTINTQHYNSGLYFYRMYDEAGMQLNTGKFSVIK